MMKHLLVIGLISILLLDSCTEISGYYDDNSPASEYRPMDPFDRIEIQVEGDYFINYGTEYSLEVNTRLENLDYILSEVKDSVLIVYVDGNWLDNLDFEITLPELKGMEMDVTTSYHQTVIQFARNFFIDDLEINIAQSFGHTSVENLQANELSINLGGGALYLDGDTQRLNVFFEDQSNLYASDLLSAVSEITFDNYGSAIIRTTDTLKIHNPFGNGEIHCYGNPHYIEGDPTGLTIYD